MRKLRRQTPPDVAVTSENENEHQPLDRAQVVQAALDLLDEVGLDGMTMRRLAEKLGIKAGSLYWHVKNKEELLDLLAEEICAAVPEPAKGQPWRVALEAVAHEYRRVLKIHRDGAQILAGTMPTGANRLRLMESLFSFLLAAGFTLTDAAYAGFLMNDFVTEFVVEESRYTTPENQDGVASPADQFRNFFASLSPQTYPSIVKLSQYLLGDNLDERFRFGMQVLLDGLEKRLK